MLVELANRAFADGNRVSVCVTRAGSSLGQSLHPGITLHALNRRRRFEVDAFRSFAKLVREGAVDVMHAHGLSTFAFVASLKTASSIDTPVVFHDHKGSIEIDQSIPLWFRVWAKSSIDKYVGVCSKLADWALRAGIPPDRVSVIENAIDLSSFQSTPPSNIRAEFGIVDGSLLGITVGNLRYEKGIDVLLDALSTIACRTNIKIMHIGRPDDMSYAKLCEQKLSSAGLGDVFFFLGQRSDVPKWLRSADFAVMPSRSESGPLVLIEYMAAGLPFVSTRVGGVAHKAEAANVPGFVPPSNPLAFGQAVEELVTLPSSERVNRGEFGRKVAAKYFDVRIVMDRWYNVYDQALKARSH